MIFTLVNVPIEGLFTCICMIIRATPCGFRWYKIILVRGIKNTVLLIAVILTYKPFISYMTFTNFVNVRCKDVGSSSVYNRWSFPFVIWRPHLLIGTQPSTAALRASQDRVKADRESNGEKHIFNFFISSCFVIRLVAQTWKFFNNQPSENW